MKPIIQLEQNLINKIAAGEVVERPLSIVKELTENAIDAGASVITVEIRDGGLGMVRITDNGMGIPAEQILLAFARHATSKLATADDLFEIHTLGFRGEALSSIAAVSQVEMITKTQDALTGSRVEIHGGKCLSRKEIGCANGTTLVVSNLFFNTPARRKFLKKAAVEAGYISDCMQKLALGSPKLSFRYINNGQPVFQTNGNGDLKTIILHIYGRETASKMVELEVDKIDLKLSGFIGKPEIARGNRQYGHFFINRRYIQSRLLQQSVEAGMKTMLPSGRFPVYVLHLDIPPSMIDVNVHPTKMDVRFAHEEETFDFVKEAVYGTLADSNLIPEVHFKQRTAPEEPALYDEIKIPANIYKNNLNKKEYIVSEKKYFYQSGRKLSVSVQSTQDIKDPRKPDVILPPEENDISPKKYFIDYTILGLLFNTYWIISQDESLFLIDQHAAHERVLYEEILELMKNDSVDSQYLLEPETLRLTEKEIQSLREHMPVFNNFGFEIEITGLVRLLSVPFIFKGPVSAAFFTELLDAMAEPGVSDESYIEKKIAVTACREAVKANDKISEKEAETLIVRLLALENPFTCPHGRPTIIEISKKEIERKFKRT